MSGIRCGQGVVRDRFRKHCSRGNMDPGLFRSGVVSKQLQIMKTACCLDTVCVFIAYTIQLFYKHPNKNYPESLMSDVFVFRCHTVFWSSSKHSLASSLLHLSSKHSRSRFPFRISSSRNTLARLERSRSALARHRDRNTETHPELQQTPRCAGLTSYLTVAMSYFYVHLGILH